MSLRAAAPGPQLSSGRLRVDAARAIKKLREYQLADRTTWVLEAIRAAVASRATRIELTGDSNDVWLAWEGPPWPLELLPKLFDELVSPSPANERQHVRLLASAVNSALGMNPEYVAVYSIDNDGLAHVTRYTPDVLAEPENELGEAPLRELEVEVVETPARAKPGMLVHLRRRLSLEVLGYLIGDPPELAVARDACGDIAVPLHLGRMVLHRDNTSDVLRVPLGDGLDGFVAITDPMVTGGDGSTLEVAEHGVGIACYSLSDGETFDSIPLCVFVDGIRMPTNASRSQVRVESHPISTAEERAKKLEPEVIGKLAELVKAGSEPARGAALAWIASRIGGGTWHVEAPAIRDGLRVLAELPLVKNAIGEARPLTSHWRAEIHTGAKPFAEALSPWLSDVLWLAPKDRATRQLTRGLPTDDRATRRLVRWARRQERAHRAFFAHQKREARVIAAAEPRVRVKLPAELASSCVDQSKLTGFSGEVCVYPEGRSVPTSGGVLIVLLDGRELERISYPSALRFDAVIESPRVSPSDRYRGVKRDAELAKVERAMFGCVVRCLEALALARSGDAPKGFQLGRDLGPAADGLLFRRGIELVEEQQLKLRGPLLGAPAWPTSDGKWLGISELTGKAIGIARPGVVTAPRGRIVVHVTESERIILDRHVAARLVRYDRVPGAGVSRDVTRLAEQLADEYGGALAIRDVADGGAIAPAQKSTIQLTHMGMPVAKQPYKAKYTEVAITIDADDIIPDTDWRSAIDDCGLLARDYSQQERDLLRAIAATMVGARPPDFVTPARVRLGDRLGLVLCDVLAEVDAQELLGPELTTKLRASKLLTILGWSGPCAASADDLAEMFSESIPYLATDADPVPGFTPLLSSETVARAVGKLVDRKVHDGTHELMRQQRLALFERRLAAHRAKPVAKTIALPRAIDEVTIHGAMVKGVAGISDGGFELHVFVEGRQFDTLFPWGDAPIVAAIEIDAVHCGETFEAIPDKTLARIVSEIRMLAIPALLVKIATTKPHLLGDPGPTRELLAKALDANLLDAQTKARLAAAPGFRTLQGKRVSLDTALQSRKTISIASWEEDSWLGPGSGEVTALDEPILVVSDATSALVTICEKLHPGVAVVVDVTEDVVRLQARRRMAAGLLPTPKLPGVPEARKRQLADFGEDGKKLGHGEIGLTEADESVVYLHVNGKFQRRARLDVLPVVELAIEDPDLSISAQDMLRDLGKLVDSIGEKHPISTIAQRLAAQLVAKVTAAKVELSPVIRGSLVRAVFARRITASQLGKQPVLLTLDGRWVDWSVFVAQAAMYREVWAVSNRPLGVSSPQRLTHEPPLDADRVVFILPEEDMTRARAHSFDVIDATKELELDALARTNRARLPARSLELPLRDGVLAQELLPGDGLTLPRGLVAVLAPAAAAQRGLYPHRMMQRFDRVDDPCAWPTVAVVDDARFVPDRTWSKPKADETWQALCKAIREASERALGTIDHAPPDALVSLRVTNADQADVKALHGSQIRGVVWLAGAPKDLPVRVRVAHRDGVRTFVPEDELALGGSLLLHASDGLDTGAALEQLCGAMYGKLVRALIKHPDNPDPDLVLAHLAHALALQLIKPTETRAFKFDCFVPEPIDGRELSSLLRRQHKVDVIAPDQTTDEDIAVIDDGTHTSRVVIAHLGKRARRAFGNTPVVPTPAPPAPVKVAPAALPGLPPEKKPPAPPAPPPLPRKRDVHPLEPLVEQLSKRLAQLGIAGYDWTIVEREQPMFKMGDAELLVAGDNEHLRELAAAHLANTAWVPGAIDAVVAHAVTVLNVALTSVTDAMEAHALQGLLVSQPSADPPRSRRSS